MALRELKGVQRSIALELTATSCCFESPFWKFCQSHPLHRFFSDQVLIFNTSGLQTLTTFIHRSKLFQKLDNTLHWINLYPVNNTNDFPNTCPLDSYLSDS